MKEILKNLYAWNPRYYAVWSYLWVMSDKETEFDFSELCHELSVPRSTMYRILKHYENWNQEKIFVDCSIESGVVSLRFYDKGKARTKKAENYLLTDAMVFLNEYYAEKNYDYINLKDHKGFADKILEKVRSSVEARQGAVDDTKLLEAFKLFFSCIPKWWQENSFTLPTINKNYTKIFNQIKQQAHGKSSIAEEKTELEDFRDLANQ